MFVKGIPLYDSQAAPIRTLTQVSVKMTLKLKCGKRRTAYFCPTWGPFSGEQLYYHNAQKLIYQEAYIRYRTGGARRTWQNLNRTQKTASKSMHGREDTYALPVSKAEITSQWYATSTFPQPPDVGIGGLSVNDEERNNREIEITVAQDGTSTVAYKPKLQPRKKTQSPEKYADVQMMEHFTQM